MELITSDISLLTLAAFAMTYVAAARFFTLGPLSLPCVTILTSIVYFYLMPALAFSGKGEAEFLGMYLLTLEWPHVAVFLYIVGVVFASLVMRKYLTTNPAAPREEDRQLNFIIMVALAALAVGGLVAQISLGRLSFSDSYVEAADAGYLAFINLFFTMMVPLTLVYMIRVDFSLPSWILLLVVSVILLQTGFRYRLILMAFGVASSYMLVRGIKVRIVYVVAGTLFGMLGGNLMVTSRTYGRGVDLTKLDGFSVADLLQSFGGEIGPLFSFSYVASNPLPDPVYATPWVVAASRLVPSFLWKDKPMPDYLDYYFGGFSVENAKAAGVAAPQHVEMLLQFGWIGLPVLAFLYFYVAGLIVKKLDGLGRESRVAGFSLVPAFFGFYMQTRGYFFQVLSDGLFLFAPLFVLYLGEGKRARSSLGAARATQGGYSRAAPVQGRNRAWASPK